MEKISPVKARLIEEFVEHDHRGNPVVLRRTISNESASSDPHASSFQTEAPSAQGSSWHVSGSMRFFAGFGDVKNHLRAKFAKS